MAFVAIAGISLVLIGNLRYVAQALLVARMRSQIIRAAFPGCTAFGARLVCGEALLVLEHFDDIDHVVRIVIEAREIFGAKLVRLRFLATAVFRHIAGSYPLRSLRSCAGSATHSLTFEYYAEKCRGQHADPRCLLPSSALRTMPRGNVADFVANNACQVGFTVHVGHDAPRDIDVTPGQRECIDVRGIEHRKVPVKLRAM